MSKDLVVVDMDGLREIARGAVHQRGFGIVGGEVWQNCMDEKPSRVDIAFEAIHGKPLIKFRAEDDGPGYRDLSHAWTMFAPSYKKDDPDKAGRFNFGCKFVLCFCKTASIHTTSGTVTFDRDKGREVFPRRKRDKGTVFEAVMNCTRQHYFELLKHMRQVIVPEGTDLYVNGQQVKHRAPVTSFEEILPTVIGNDLRPTRRKTKVEIYDADPKEKSYLYELGVPVVSIECKWNINVMQKVPLNTDRDNVPPKYLRDLLGHTINVMHEALTKEDVQKPWATAATDNDNCNKEAMASYLTQKYGKKRVVADPSDTEATKRAVSEGYTVIPSRGLTSGQREKLREHPELAKPAGRVFPTPSAYSTDPDAPLVKIIERDKWTEGMKLIHDYTVALAKKLMLVAIKVKFVHTDNAFEACYGGRSLDFNTKHLGTEYFNHGITVEVDTLIIHEFGHEYESDHLSSNYHEALCILGAKLKKLALEQPEFFNKFNDLHCLSEHLGSGSPFP